MFQMNQLKKKYVPVIYNKKKKLLICDYIPSDIVLVNIVEITSIEGRNIANIIIKTL